jgi:hypothetical protein
LQKNFGRDGAKKNPAGQKKKKNQDTLAIKNEPQNNIVAPDGR